MDILVDYIHIPSFGVLVPETSGSSGKKWSVVPYNADTFSMASTSSTSSVVAATDSTTTNSEIYTEKSDMSNNITNKELEVNNNILNVELQIIRGCSSTEWVRSTVDTDVGTVRGTGGTEGGMQGTKLTVSTGSLGLKAKIIKPPKIPYDQKPTLCVYRGFVSSTDINRVIGRVYTKPLVTTTVVEESMKNQEELVGVFEMIRRVTN